MITLELTDEEGNILINIIDQYARSTGLSGANNALFFHQKIKAAENQKLALEKQALEKAKEAAKQEEEN